MSIITIFLTAISLASDAFVVSISNVMSIKNLKFRDALTFGFSFGIFQFSMPIIGFFLANIFSKSISKYDNYISFIILTIIGVKMIIDSFTDSDEKNTLKCDNILKLKNIIILSIATSIDALAVGVSVSFIDVNIFLLSSVIGIITFLISTIGALLGKKINSIFKNFAPCLGGIILIVIAIYFLIE